MFLPESIHEIAPLIVKYLRDELTVEEEIQLNKWASASEENRFYLESLSAEKIIRIDTDYNEEAIWEKIKLTVAPPAHAPALPSRHPFYRRLTAAALVTVMLAAGTWLIWNNTHKQSASNPTASIYKNDVAPGGNKATLTLANGSIVILDTAAKGKVSQQGNTKILKTGNGQLAYTMDPSGLSHGREQLLNSVTTPRGGQYQLVLADGTRVWLNAASSLRYPVYFTGKERAVELTGEAYFEVAKNPKLPFRVKVNGMEVEVLGTHFNIMAYSDEREAITTLLEGSVKIIKGTANALLKPGQQSQVDEKGMIKIVDNANMDEVMSWKNGFFQFEQSDIQTIMRQVARWYDVDVSVEGNIADHFHVAIPRNVAVSKLFNALELTGHVHFKVDGRKVIVLQ